MCLAAGTTRGEKKKKKKTGMRRLPEISAIRVTSWMSAWQADAIRIDETTGAKASRRDSHRRNDRSKNKSTQLASMKQPAQEQVDAIGIDETTGVRAGRRDWHRRNDRSKSEPTQFVSTNCRRKSEPTSPVIVDTEIEQYPRLRADAE